MRTMKYVTMGFDGWPTIVTDDGYIYPRRAELIFHKEYYTYWPHERWPIDPNTGDKLPIQPMNHFRSRSRKTFQMPRLSMLFIRLIGIVRKRLWYWND